MHSQSRGKLLHGLLYHISLATIGWTDASYNYSEAGHRPRKSVPCWGQLSAAGAKPEGVGCSEDLSFLSPPCTFSPLLYCLESPKTYLLHVAQDRPPSISFIPAPEGHAYTFCLIWTYPTSSSWKDFLAPLCVVCMGLWWWALGQVWRDLSL